MSEEMLIRAIAVITGGGFFLLGLYYRTRKDRAVQPWANVKSPPRVNDVIRYNKTVGLLFILYGAALFVTLFLTILGELWVLASVVIIMLLTIALVTALVFVQNKYRIKE